MSNRQVCHKNLALISRTEGSAYLALKARFPLTLPEVLGAADLGVLQVRGKLDAEVLLNI